ncbi:uncharacterized protein LOC115880901 [Sitophilus oryzae]|uniref:Uncharacterized protein LOC115880901 n=1 Tax=Sitophilus oryzae TaxID=7048 RepID=A0A6J2XRE8_SITOR|nr:uncharacterized protein LOC115880901 [Sitophilus oryzae]
MAEKTKFEDLEGLIKGTIKGELIEQSAKYLLEPGENYGSVMYKVDFKVNDDGKVKEYHAVAKCTPLNKVTQEMFNIQVTFKAEIGWYTTVVPAYQQFQNDQGAKSEINFFQKLYGSRINLQPESDVVDEDGVILTENLTCLGYRNVDRHKGFDLNATYSVLRDLAAFHAIPLAIRLKDGNLFEKKVAPYFSNFVMDPKLWTDVAKMVLDIIDEIPSCLYLKERIRQNVENAKPYEPHYSGDGVWKTVIHNDFWSNNVMVTDDEDPKTIILDLQVPNMGNPAMDVIFFLLTSVSLDVITDRLEHFIHHYYVTFIAKLTELGVSTDKYKYVDFLNEIDRNATKWEFMHALCHTQIIMNDKGESDFDSRDVDFKMEDIDFQVKLTDRHKIKFESIILEAAKRHWI